MAKHTPSRTLAALAAVQRVHVLAANAALIAAREAEAQARVAQDVAVEAVTAAHLCWQEQLDRPNFAPDFARALAEELVRRDGESASAAERARIAVGLHQRRRDDWSVADARAEAIDEAHADARHAERRRSDARDALASADRISQRWRPR